MTHRGRGEEIRDWSILLDQLPNFVMSSFHDHHKSPPGDEYQVRRGRRRPASEPRWKRKMLFKFLDAVPRHEEEGDVVGVVAG